MKYRAALLPRAYKAYVPMTEDSWRTFLSDADVLENGIATLKAELVFAALAQRGEMDYRSFRQAMRQVAVALYPQLPEADALKLLGQKHVFPRVKLVPEREASDLLPYQPETDSPRLLELLKREGGVVRDPVAHRDAIETVIAAATALSWNPQGLIASPITGPAGNHEYLLWLSEQDAAPLPDLDQLVATTLAV